MASAYDGQASLRRNIILVIIQRLTTEESRHSCANCSPLPCHVMAGLEASVRLFGWFGVVVIMLCRNPISSTTTAGESY